MGARAVAASPHAPSVSVSALQIWLSEVVSILRSEHGPHGATKKEYEKAKVLVNQFLAADCHIKPTNNPAPTVISSETSGASAGLTNNNMSEAYCDNRSQVTMVNAYPLEEADKNK